jgi:hypothetical protein
MYIIIMKLYRPQDIIVEMNSFFFQIFPVFSLSIVLDLSICISFHYTYSTLACCAGVATWLLWEKHKDFGGKNTTAFGGKTQKLYWEKKTIVLVGKLLRVIHTLINVRISINLGNGLYPSAPKVE